MQRVLLLAFMLYVAGCEPALRRVPLPPLEDPSPRKTQRPIPGHAPIHEEPVDESTTSPRDSEPPQADESDGTVLAMIRSQTTPQAATAIRLVEQARIQLGNGNVNGALDDLERAIAIDPNNAYAYYYIGECHFARQAFDQAIAFAERAAVLASVSDARWAGRAWALQGRVYEAAGRFADARRAFQFAVDTDPQNRVAQAGLKRLGRNPAVRP